MKKIILILLSASVVIFCFDGCKDKDDDPDPNPTLLEHFYEGDLVIFYSNAFPEFEATTSISVEVNRYGDMTFEQGTLFYSGTSDNGQAKLQREGELTIAPYGETIKNGDEIMFEVDENTVVVETYKMWVWDGQQWIIQVDESITDTWNNGLSFTLAEAVEEGSENIISNANGTLRWTFYLNETGK